MQAASFFAFISYPAINQSHARDKEERRSVVQALHSPMLLMEKMNPCFWPQSRQDIDR